MNATIDLALIAAFVAVQDEGSFTAAARALNSTTATVSRQVAKLEGIVGTPLFHRTTRRVVLTTGGAALYAGAASHVQALGRVLGQLPERQDEPAGTLRITAPQDFGAIVLGPIVAQFTAQYPAVQIEAEFSTRFEDLVAGGFDLAIRSDSASDADPSWRRLPLLSRGEIGFFASPDYVAHRGEPTSLDDPGHRWIAAPALQRRLPEAVFEASVRANDMLFLREVARASGGIVLLPTFIAAPLVRSGDLIRILPEATTVLGGMVLLYPGAEPLPSKIAAFRDFLVKSIREITALPNVGVT